MPGVSGIVELFGVLGVFCEALDEELDPLDVVVILKWKTFVLEVSISIPVDGETGACATPSVSTYHESIETPE